MGLTENVAFQDRLPHKRGSIHMTLSMSVQEKRDLFNTDNCLIELTIISLQPHLDRCDAVKHRIENISVTEHD